MGWYTRREKLLKMVRSGDGVFLMTSFPFFLTIHGLIDGRASERASDYPPSALRLSFLLMSIRKGKIRRGKESKQERPNEREEKRKKESFIRNKHEFRETFFSKILPFSFTVFCPLFSCFSLLQRKERRTEDRGLGVSRFSLSLSCLCFDDS